MLSQPPRSFAEAPRPVSHYLVVAYDGCAFVPLSQKFTNPTLNPYYTSPGLVDFCQTISFKAFYGRTHRHLITDFSHSLSEDRLDLFTSLHIPGFNARNFLTTSITQNLEQALRLSAIEVSTPDDSAPTIAALNIQAQCGYGYRKFITCYEEILLAANKNNVNPENTKFIDVLHELTSTPAMWLRHFGSHFCTMQYDPKSKRAQLLQIAEHAAVNEPESTIELYVLDDDAQICQDDLNTLPESLPENVTVHVYHHQHGMPVGPQLGYLKGTNQHITLVSRAKILHCSAEYIAILQNLTDSNSYLTAIKEAVTRQYWHMFEVLFDRVIQDHLYPLVAIYNHLTLAAESDHALATINERIIFLQNKNLLDFFIHKYNCKQLSFTAFVRNNFKTFTRFVELGFATSDMLETLLLAATIDKDIPKLIALLSVQQYMPFNIDAKTEKGFTALHLAKEYNRDDICQLLVAAGAQHEKTLAILSQTHIKEIEKDFHFHRLQKFFHRISNVTKQTLVALKAEPMGANRYLLANRYIHQYPNKELSQVLRRYVR